jgi:hypothetical protein
MRSRLCAAPLLFAAVVGAYSCVLPNLRHIEHVHDVVRVQVGHDTREQVRALLGVPRVVDTPELYVYDWEKSKAVFVIAGGSGGGWIPLGFAGTRALIRFDDAGLVAHVEVEGAGQSDVPAASVSPDRLPRAQTIMAPKDSCAYVQPMRMYYAGPESRLVLHCSNEIRVCDGLGAKSLGRLAGRFSAFAVSPNGRFAATYDRDKVLMLRDGATLAPLAQLDPATEKGRTASDGEFSPLGFSADGGRLVAVLPKLGTVVYDTSDGEAILRRSECSAAMFSPDGRLLLTWVLRAGLFLTEVDTGHDVFQRQPPARPWGGGSAAFSPDGRSLAIASCAHAEVWDLDTMTSSGGAKGLADAFLLPFSKMLETCRSWTAFSPDGGTLAVATEGTVTLYDLAAHRLLESYAIAEPITGVAFTTDLTRAAFTADYWSVATWEVGKTAAEAHSSAPNRP